MAQGLRVNATVDYTDAYLTVNDSAIGAKSGDQLPTSPRWTASLTADYLRPIDDRMSVTLGGGYRYRDMLVNDFPMGVWGSLPLRPQNIVDLYTGLQLKRIALRLYGRNVFNNRSYTGLPIVFGPVIERAVPTQPRTIGLSADYRF